MTYEEAVKGFEEATVVTPEIMLGLVIFSFIAMLVVSYILEREFPPRPFYIMVAIALMFLVTFLSWDVQFERWEDWEDEVERNYIEDLPMENVNVVDFVKVGERDSESYSVGEHESTDTMKVVFVQDGIPSELIMDVNVKKVKGLEESYLTYRYLEKSIPEVSEGQAPSYKSGYYNATLYVRK